MSIVSRFVKRQEWMGRHEILATWVALGILFVYWLVGAIVRTVKHFFQRKKKKPLKVKPCEKVIRGFEGATQSRITQADLQRLIQELDEQGSSTSPWEAVLDKSNQSVSYFAKRREPKDGGPTEYFSITVFRNCSAEVLRDFYMDNEFRLQWDKTVLKHEQLDVCMETGTEVGRTIKKFPLMMAREYVLAWRLWEGEGKAFYCVIKACDHPGAPRKPDCKRVEDYLSGWRIQPVPGSHACEVKMLHREDIGMRREMAKMAFSSGIWSYVNKMEQHLRKYSCMQHRRHENVHTAVTLCHKVPLELELKVQGTHVSSEFSNAGVCSSSRRFGGRFGGSSDSLRNECSRFGGRFGESLRNECSSGNLRNECSSSNLRNECKRPISWLTQSMFLVGWAVFLGHGSTSLGAKIAGAVFMNKAVRRRQSSRDPGRYVSKSLSISRRS